MKSQENTVMEKQAEFCSKFLEKEGHAVPLDVVSRMLAQSAKILGLINPESMVTTIVEPLTKRLRLIHNSSAAKRNEWIVIPPEMEDLYKAQSTVELLDEVRAQDVLGDLDLTEGVLPTLHGSDVDAGVVMLDKVFIAAPNINKYGMPPMSWLVTDEGFSMSLEGAVNLTIDDILDLHDMGDDSGGMTIVEVLVTDAVYGQFIAKQEALYSSVSQVLLGDIRQKSQKHQFQPNFREILDAEYSGMFPATPGFYKIFSER